MITNTDSKLKSLLDDHLPGTVLLASWLEKKGFSHDLQKYYRRSGWLESMGVGAFKRPKELVYWPGALHSIQIQAKLPIHAGGPTALSLLGFAHFLRLQAEPIYLFSSPNTRLPKWFTTYQWNGPVNHIKTHFLPAQIGVAEFEGKGYSFWISTPERAILECIYLVPDRMDMAECFRILEGLTNLRPGLMQELLEECTSVKVKRLFLYFADKLNHQWFSFINTSKINLGAGERSIAKGGVYNSKYRIAIPTEWANL